MEKLAFRHSRAEGIGEEVTIDHGFSGMVGAVVWHVNCQNIISSETYLLVHRVKKPLTDNTNILQHISGSYQASSRYRVRRR